MRLNLIDKSAHYNVIKVITTVLVVFAHASRMYTGSGVVTPVNSSSVLCSLTEYIYSFHMPLFLAVSGMVYGLCIDDLGKYDKAFPFIKNKAIRLLIPYLFFGFCVVAPTMVLCDFCEMPFFEYCLKGIILGENCRHLWYILVLFEIFLVCALCKKFIQKTYSIPIIILLLLTASYFSAEMPVTMQLGNLFNYFIYFYLGYLFNRYYDSIIKVIKNPIALVVLFVASVLLMGQVLWGFMLLRGVIGCLFALGITKYFPEFLTEKKLFIAANKNGFGIYLFHPMIVYISFYYLGEKNINPVLLCLGVTVFAYALSWFLTVLFRRIKLGVLLGE